MKFNTYFPPLRLSLRRLFYSLLMMAGLLHVNANAQMIGAIGLGDVEGVMSGRGAVSNKASAEALRSELSNALLKTRKFTILEYSPLTERLARRGLTLKGFYDKTYKSTELLQAGLDYILTADIVKFSAARERRNDVVLGVGRAEIDFTFLGVADITDDFEFRVSAQTSIKELSGDTLSDDAVSEATMRKVIDTFIRKVTAKLHPMRVMKISEESLVTLNYGAGVLQAGDTVLVYPKSEEPSLDNTGKPLGKSVATLRVINAQTKFATANVLTGFSELEKRQKVLLLMSGE